MPTPPVADHILKEALDAYKAAGNSYLYGLPILNEGRSEDQHVPYGTFRDRVKMAKSRGFDQPTGVQDSVTKAGLDYSTARGGWRRVYDEETGKQLDTVVYTLPKEQPEDLAERIMAALSGLPAADAIQAPGQTDADLITIYPLADAHIGMMAWGRETGEDYDTTIATDRVRTWIARAVDASPASGEAVILGVGDLTHADDQNNMTPRSKHILDVDTRHFKTLELTIAALAYGIEYAARKHAKVTVRILPGNHDQNTYMAIMFALAERYRANPRVTVQKVPGEFWVYQFGANLFAAHHGHGGKPERMVMMLADEHAAEWGQTRHRVLWTGHLHHAKMADIGGVTWEQLRAVTARDAYAAANAYVARAQLQAITFDRHAGEVMRVKVAA